MTYKDILKLPEGAHAVTVNTERCMVVRLREGYTLTTFFHGRMMLIQRYSERGHLLWKDKVEDIFSAAEETERDRQEEHDENTDC